MNNWEAVAREADWIRNEIDGPFANFQCREVRSALTVILDHLACCRPDDLAARSVRNLVGAWLEAARHIDV